MSAAAHRRGLALAVTGMVCLSPDGLLIRLVTAEPWQIVFWRGLFNFLALAVYLQASRPGGLAGALRQAGRPGLTCALLLTAGTVLFIASITRTTVANTLFILGMIPLFAAVLGLAFLRERVPPRTWAAMTVALVGIGLIFSGSVDAGRGGSLLGDLLAAGTALCMAGSLVVIRAHPQVSMFPALCLSGLLAALVAAGLTDPFAVGLRDLGLMATMGMVQQAFAIGLFLHGARHLAPAEAGLVGLIETVLGPLWVWLAVGETPSPWALAGGALVLAALAAHSIRGLHEAKRSPEPPPGA